MGNTQSEWTGVKLAITNTLNENGYYDFLPISCTNAIKIAGSSQIETDARDNSTFKGYMHFYDADNSAISDSLADPWTGAAGSVTIDNALAYVQRLIEQDEQTDTDETVIRLEAGRSLKGTYYQKDGTGINFTVDLQSAISSLVGATGLAIAATVSLLTF